MPEIEVSIGGRNFMVSCQPGEEHLLRSAAAQLDVEAQPLLASMGRLPEGKMLLMAGLMLADRTAAQEDEMRELRAKLSALEDRPEPEARRIEVPVIPPQVPLTFAELAARAEALAERIGEKAAPVAGRPPAPVPQPEPQPEADPPQVPEIDPPELAEADPQTSPEGDPQGWPDADPAQDAPPGDAPGDLPPRPSAD